MINLKIKDFVERLKSVRYKTILPITRAICGTSRDKFYQELQSWTLIRGHMRNMAKKCFSANVSLSIFGLLFQTGTINNFSYQDWVLGCY